MYKGYEPADDPTPCDLSDLNHVSESSLLIRHCVSGEKPFQPVALQLVAEYCVEASLSPAHAHELLSRLTRAGLVSGAFTVEGIVEAVARANGTLPPKGIVVLERLLEQTPKPEEPTLTATPATGPPLTDGGEGGGVATKATPELKAKEKPGPKVDPKHHKWEDRMHSAHFVSRTSYNELARLQGKSKAEIKRAVDNARHRKDRVE